MCYSCCIVFRPDERVIHGALIVASSSHRGNLERTRAERCSFVGRMGERLGTSDIIPTTPRKVASRLFLGRQYETNKRLNLGTPKRRIVA